MLRRGLEVGGRPSDYRLELETWETELRPGLDLTDRESLCDAMDGRGWMRALDRNVLVYALVPTGDTEFRRFPTLDVVDPLQP